MLRTAMPGMTFKVADVAEYLVPDASHFTETKRLTFIIVIPSDNLEEPRR